MTYAPRPNEFVPYYDVPAAHRAPQRAGLWRRLAGAIFESRQRRAELEAERFIARSGGRLTDEIERQITERLITGKWWN